MKISKSQNTQQARHMAAQHRKTIAKMLTAIEASGIMQPRDTDTWATVGSLNHVIELLGEIVQFIGSDAL